MTVKVDQQACVAARVSHIDITMCHFSDDGHDWIEITTITDLMPTYICTRCDARGVDDNDDDLRSEMIRAGI